MAAGRSILAVLGGAIVAGAAIALAEAVGHAALDGAAVFGAVAVGYGVGALAGTMVATRIAGARVAVAIPITLGGLAVVNLFSFPHPLWFLAAAPAGLAAGWLAGAWLMSRRPVSGANRERA